MEKALIIHLSIQLILLILMWTFGMCGFMKYKKRKKFRKYLKSFYPILILPFLDVFSTFLFVSRWGANSEGNPIGRIAIHFLGNYSYPLLYLFAITNLFILICFNYRIAEILYKLNKDKLKKKKIRKKDYIRRIVFVQVIVLVIVYTIILINNFYAYFF